MVRMAPLSFHKPHHTHTHTHITHTTQTRRNQRHQLTSAGNDKRTTGSNVAVLSSSFTFSSSSSFASTSSSSFFGSFSSVAVAVAVGVGSSSDMVTACVLETRGRGAIGDGGFTRMSAVRLCTIHMVLYCTIPQHRRFDGCVAAWLCGSGK